MNDLSSLLSRGVASIMGIINCSPESFYPPSVKVGAREVSDAVLKFIEEGAEIIDVGGTSTAPKSYYSNAKYASATEELERVMSAVRAIRDLTDVPLSVDTTRARVAEAALKLGADIVNDVSGLKRDRGMLDVIREYQPYVILMASNTGFGDVSSFDDAVNALRVSVNLAFEAGLDRDRIILDPGFGFGKPVKLSFEFLGRLKDFKREFNMPLLVGISRKSFIRDVVGSDDEDILHGTQAATVISVLNGADIIRTHDVKAVKAALMVVDFYLKTFKV